MVFYGSAGITQFYENDWKNKDGEDPDKRRGIFPGSVFCSATFGSDKVFG